MKLSRCPLLLAAFLFAATTANAETFANDVKPLIEKSCLGCHDEATTTGLNFEKLGHDLDDPETFRKWVRVFDRVSAGEMPPPKRKRPDPKVIAKALGSLKRDLHASSAARQKKAGRVPARRLTKREIGYTIQDLLGIDIDVTSGIPDEVESSSFDTVGSSQRLSAVHMESYLKAADEALDAAIRLGRKPHRKHVFDFQNSKFLNEFHDKPLNDGGNVTLKLDDGIALFADIDYLFRSSFHGYNFRTPGIYRITSEVAAYQSKKPVTAKLVRRESSGAAELVKAYDLKPGKTETLVVTGFFRPGDDFYITFHTGQTQDEVYGALFASRGAKRYKGKGILNKSQHVEGPLTDAWPPKSTHELLHGTKLVPKRFFGGGAHLIRLSKPPIDHVGQVVQRIAPRIFRRPVREGELESFVRLARPAIEEKRPFQDVVRIPLRSMFASPQFLLFDAKPGKLDDYALASRLSYFLWKSLPDDKLFALAKAGKLSDPKVLADQVERMLDDDKATRFHRDFLGQWLRLYKVNATTPDDKLYPEYDELLGTSIPKETELFFQELVGKNLKLANLIDSDFTFLNRRLAEHYGIEGVEGQHFRRVDLPEDSPRGGVLTQAAILKTTANGTTTSPVMRGNFVLSNLLGTPPSPPPPDIGSIEPDTRGKTTIREILAAHRDNATCAKCHREIDPPGFALESFDPIGGYRTNYRATNAKAFAFFQKKTYRKGPSVDAGGVTADGKKFAGIREFKQLLLRDKEQLARSFVSQLVVYSTGGEIQFADRKELDAILDRTRKSEFAVRDIIHAVVQSKLFRHK